MNHTTRGLLAPVGVICMLGFVIWGLRAEHALHPPLPPHAAPTTELLIPGTQRQTTFWVPAPIAEVRRFYHELLPPRGWRYCGTQDTHGCSNMQRLPGVSQDIDVYRRMTDHDGTGSTIEIWPIWNAELHATFVTVYERSSLAR